MAIVDEAGIKITPDTSGFAAQLRAELEREIAAATAGLDDTIHINIDVDSDAARAKLAQSLDEFGEDGTRAFDKLDAEQNDLFDGINKNTEKTRDKVVLETTKTRDRVNQRLEPFWRKLKLKLVGTKKDFDNIKKSALEASKAATGVTGNTTAGRGPNVERAEQDRQKAYAASEAAARKLAKAENDLRKVRAEQGEVDSELQKAEQLLNFRRREAQIQTDGIAEKEKRLADLRRDEPDNLRAIGKLEREIRNNREGLAGTLERLAVEERAYNVEQSKSADAAYKVSEATDRANDSRDKLVESNRRVEESERNVTRAHEEHDRALRRSESALGRFGGVLERQGGQIDRVGDGLQKLGNRTSILGKISSIAGTAVSGFGNIVSGLGGLLTGAEGASTKLTSGLSGVAGAALDAATAVFGLGIKISGFLVIAGAISYVVGAAGAALAAVVPLALSAGAAIATVALGMDGIKKAYETSLAPALDKLKAQVSEVFEQKFTVAFQNISKNLIPQVTEGFKDIAAAIGDSAIKFSEFITKGEQVRAIQTILRETADNIEQQLYPAIQNAVGAFLRFSEVPGVLDTVYGILSDLINNTARWIDELARTGEGKAAIDALRGALDTVEQVFFQVLTAAMNFFTAATPGFRNLVDSVGNLVSELLDKLGPAFNTALQAASDFINAIPQEDIDALVDAIGRLADAFSDFANSAAPGQIVEIITSIIDAFTFLVEVISTVSDAISAVSGFFEKLSIPLLGAESSTERATRKFRENEAAARGMGQGAQAAQPPIEGIGDVSATAADRAAEAGKKMGTAFDPVPPGAEKAGEGAKKGIEKPVGEIPGTVDDSVAQVDFSPILEKAREVFGALPKSVADGLNGAEQAMKTGTDKLKSTAQTGAQAAVDAFKTALGTLGQVATEAVTKAQTAFATSMVKLQTAATQGAVAVVNAFKTSFAKLEPDVKEVMDKAAQAVEQGIQKITAAFDSIDTSKATQSFKEFETSVQESMRAAQQAVETAMRAIQQSIETSSQSSSQSVTTNFDQIKQKITESMDQSKQKVQEAMQEIARIVQSEGQTAVQNAQKVGDDILKVFTDLAEKMEQAGRTMMERLAAGITAGGASAVAAAQGVAAQIAAQFPSSPAKEGPLSGSGDTQVSGGKIMVRLGEGMEQKAEEALSKVRRVAQEAQQMINSINSGGQRGNGAGYGPGTVAGRVFGNNWRPTGNNDPRGTRYEDGSVKQSVAQSAGGMDPQALYEAVAAGVAAGMPDKLRIEDDGRSGVARLGNRGNRSMSRQ